MGTSKGYIPPKNKEWRKAKSDVTRMVNGSEGSEGVKKVVSSYATAYLSTQMGLSSMGKVAGQVLGFLGDLKTNGLNHALLSEGLNELIGKDNEEICNGLINYFCGENKSIDDGVVRDCLVEVFEDKEIIDLDDIDKIGSNEFLIEFIIKYIQFNFEVAFSEKILGLFPNIDEANNKVSEVKMYIDDKLRNMYEKQELLEIDWRSEEGIRFINERCEESYKLLEIFEEV